MDVSHVAVWPEHSILQIVGLAVSKRRRRRHEQGAIFGMNQLVEFRKRNASFLRGQTKDAVCFVGPQGDVRLDVALPVADVRETLRVFQPALAVAYTTKHQEARQP